jgi:hypothetical protein
MRTIARTAAAAVFLLLLSGCTVGIVYTHTREPLTLNHHATPAAGTEATNDIKHIQFPYVGIAWGDDSLGDIAREKGLHELYYADLEYLSVLTVWRQYTVHLYGR